MSIKPFPKPDQNGAPFLEPLNPANQAGGPVAPGTWTLYCFPSEAERVFNEYKAAAERQGYSNTLQLESGTAPGGGYGLFGPGKKGCDIYIIVGTLSDPAGNGFQVSEVVGERIMGYVFPFSPGHVAYGDKNYKVVNGVALPEPGILQLIGEGGQSSGKPLVAGQSIEGGYARGIWIPVPD